MDVYSVNAYKIHTTRDNIMNTYIWTHAEDGRYMGTLEGNSIDDVASALAIKLGLSDAAEFFTLYCLDQAQ